MTQAIIEVAASRVAVYPHGYSEPIWLAAQMLLEQPTALRFDRDGKSYRVPVAKGLAAQIAEVAW